MTSPARTVTLEEYVQVPETSENLDWADLVTLDLSDFDQPGGKQKLAAEFSRAIEDVGKRESNYHLTVLNSTILIMSQGSFM